MLFSPDSYQEQIAFGDIVLQYHAPISVLSIENSRFIL